MNRSLRVFVSSTMRDLANERAEVCQKLRDFNFEPVNAEGWSPSGTSSWRSIEESLESSDVVLLLLGETYGWIPPSGPMSEFGLSVTHLEFHEARRLNIPVLPFLKKLSDESPKGTDEANKRDAFRKEVSSWETGLSVASFHLARDLADQVAKALVRFLTDDFLKARVQARASTVDDVARRMQARLAMPGARLRLPSQLVSAVRHRQAVLVAGAGMSLAAGMPSANAARAHLSETFFPGVDVSHLTFAQVAAAVESAHSRTALINELDKLLSPPHGAVPTTGHQLSLALFDTVITTNWDGLFEHAAMALGDRRAVVQSADGSTLPSRALVKLHGSMSEPDTIVIEEPHLYRFPDSHPRLWAECREAIKRNTLVLVGTSLHDPSVLRLLYEAASGKQGYIVVPQVDQATRHRLRSWNLEIIEASSEQFFASLSEAVQPVR